VSDYDGLLLDVVKSDGKKYTLTLKDELLPKSPDGREQSTISWEYDFKPKVVERRCLRSGTISRLHTGEERNQMPSHWISRMLRELA
jgi:hypothetical protein